MDVRFEKDICHCELLIEGPSGDDYELQMLNNHRSDVLLPFRVQYEQGKSLYCYDVSGLVSLFVLLEQKAAGAALFERLIRSLIRALEDMSEYLLDPESLTLDTRLIFTDMQGQIFKYTCVPGISEDDRRGTGHLSSELLAHVDYTDHRSVLLIYDFYRMERLPDFNFDKLKELLSEKTDETSLTDKEKSAAAAEELPFDAEDYEDIPVSADKADKKRERRLPFKLPVSFKAARRFLPVILAALCLPILYLYHEGLIQRLCLRLGLDIDARWVSLAGIICLSGAAALIFLKGYKGGDKGGDKENAFELSDFEDETESYVSFSDMTMEMDGDATVLLGSYEEPLLLRSLKEEQPDLNVSRFPVVIGSGRDADCRIDAPAVSRRHALIDRDDRGLFITDLESTNGTWVNGRRLPSGRQSPLSDGDRVRLADCEYELGVGSDL